MFWQSEWLAEMNSQRSQSSSFEVAPSLSELPAVRCTWSQVLAGSPRPWALSRRWHEKVLEFCDHWKTLLLAGCGVCVPRQDMALRVTTTGNVLLRDTGTHGPEKIDTTASVAVKRKFGDTTCDSAAQSRLC